jgi:teichuronic acid biosynthesis glycosyltransferase TuaH
MKYNKTLICLSFPAWDGNYTKSTVELMKEYSYFQKVLFIDYPYTILDLIRNKTAPVSRILFNRAYSPANYPNLKIYNLPPIIPFQQIKSKTILSIILLINSWIIRKRIANIRKIEAVNKAEWLCALNPIIGNSMAQKYAHEDFNYYCYDDIGSMKWVHQQNISEEQMFIERAKNVFCSSNNLLNKCKTSNKQTHLIENGVNLSHFKPSDVPTNASKIIGYIGSIDDRLDLSLLQFIIENNPSYQFQFIGRVLDQKIKQCLSKFSNVEFIAAMEPKFLSGYVNNFSIGIIPFIKNEFTENIFPMKVNEYLIMGKAVVSTNFADLSSIQSVIKIANSSSEFNELISSEMGSDSDESKEQRIAHANCQSWKYKAEAMYKALSNQ